MSGSKYILNIDVYDFEKIYKPTKCYIFHILVSWSDNSKYIIYRDYNEFYILQVKYNRKNFIS